MTAPTQKKASSGFTLVEVGLVIVVVAIIGTVGYLFYRNSTAKKTDTASNSSQVTAPAGTTASIDQLTQQAAAAESSVDSSADAQAVDNATSANSTIGNVGGAYDESSL